MADDPAAMMGRAGHPLSRRWRLPARKLDRWRPKPMPVGQSLMRAISTGWTRLATDLPRRRIVAVRTAAKHAKYRHRSQARIDRAFAEISEATRDEPGDDRSNKQRLGAALTALSRIGHDFALLKCKRVRKAKLMGKK
jgi:hypothetical protein